MSKYTNKFLSILFRVVIIALGLLLVITRENKFPLSIYFLVFVPYILIFYKTLFKENLYSKLRLLNDFIFISFIVYGKGLDLLILVFLSLPVINSPNHSGEKKSILLYGFYLISLFTTNNFLWSWTFISITLTLWFINGISRLRHQYLGNIAKLNLQIEKFLERDLEISKTYKIYSGLIKSINSIDIMIGYKPDITQIVCFRLYNNRLFLENSSEFIWSYMIDENTVIAFRNNQHYNDLLTNIPLTINEKKQNNNFFIFNTAKNQEYIFIFISEKPISNKFGTIYLKRILFSITNRISRVIGTENEMKSQKKKMLHDFRNKYFQIQNAEKAMHFIRNRFNTLDNFIEMSKDNISGNMDSEDLKIYKTELERLERNYQLLMERVKSILNKSDKPFSATNLEIKSINFIFNLTREIWLDYFTEFDVKVKINFELTEKQTIKINSDGFYILISDWISNLKKHSSGSRSVDFEENDESFILTFENGFLQESKEEMESLMNDFNSTERDKILQRTSHGVLIMKSILEEMNVKGQININNNILKLVLTLKKEMHEENSNF